MSLSSAEIQWAERRGISQGTLERAGVGSGTTGLLGLGKCEVIAFPYRRNGSVVNVKYRALAEKAFKQQEGGELRFWNLDEVLQAKSERVLSWKASPTVWRLSKPAYQFPRWCPSQMAPLCGLPIRRRMRIVIATLTWAWKRA
jgi:hypothetical protein